MDDFAGLTYSEEQQAQIRKIREESESRLDKVSSDPKLDADQKAAMLQGYQRIEYREIYGVLTQEQQAEVRKKIAGRRAQEPRQKQQQQPSRAR